MASDKLTILLTLKDRTAYTFRWLEYANSVRFPFKVLIADGGADRAVQDALTQKSAFPDVDYEYLRYPYDATYRDYFAKIVDALGRVRTPFVAMADNDDFLFPDCLQESAEFMAEHPDYSWCGGQCALFWLRGRTEDEHHPLYGRSVDWKCSRYAPPLPDATAADRLLGRSLYHSDPSYYMVKRTSEHLAQFRLILDCQMQDLFLVELLLCALTSIAGKAKFLDSMYLARQMNSGSSGIEHSEKFGDWFGRMLVDTWSRDFGNYVSAVGRALEEKDGISHQEACTLAIRSYRMSVAPSLLENLLEEPTINPWMTMIVPAVRHAVRLPEDSPVRKVLKYCYRRLPWISVEAPHGSEFLARPVNKAEQAFRPIEAFLTAPK
jgi:glycosyltransferase domain-containing protein